MASSEAVHTIDWTVSFGKSNAVPTIQVTPGPLLGSRRAPGNVTARLWSSLESLGADMVRYLAWFPFPRYGVASHAKGVWNFSAVAPMFDRFHGATSGRNHSTVVDFATQPSWAFSPEIVAPQDPDEPAWTYANGSPVLVHLKPMEAYYSTLYHWLRFGWAVDESGRNMTGGSVHDIPAWEVFNENEHEFPLEQYAALYDNIVSQISAAAESGGVPRPKFVALGGCSPSRVGPFLAMSRQPVDFVSLHFRSTCASRSNPAAYEEFFFSGDWFVQSVRAFVMPVLHNSTQQPKLLVDEVESVLPMDYDPMQSDPPAAYWVASGSAFALLFSQLTQISGIASVAMSHLSDFALIPEWGISKPMRPSTSMTDWTTGAPNARYHILKLLVDHFHVGSDIYTSTMPVNLRTKHFCAMSDARAGFPDIRLWCNTKGATISAIEFASFGTPAGQCGNYSQDQVCYADGVYNYVHDLCFGKSSCTIKVFPEPWEDPCEGILELLRVQASCSSGDGEAYPLDIGLVSVTPFVDSVSGHRKILVINQHNEEAVVTLNAGAFNTATMFTVDQTTTPAGPTKQIIKSLKKIVLLPFATALIVLT